MPYCHNLRIRYSECDQQGVAFNAHYMAYMDDACEVWIRGLCPSGEYRDLGWEWMIVRSTLEWQSSARNGDHLEVEVGVLRFGRTSFDLGFRGRIGEREVFRARNVCVSVAPISFEKIETPAAVRRLLEPLVDWDIPA